MTTTTTLKKIEIPASDVPARFGRYQIHVLEYGHVPGVLSGAEIRGRAGEYRDRYAASRDAVERFVARHGVRIGTLKTSPGRPLVWVDADGQPVEIFLV